MIPPLNQAALIKYAAIVLVTAAVSAYATNRWNQGTLEKKNTEIARLTGELKISNSSVDRLTASINAKNEQIEKDRKAYLDSVARAEALARDADARYKAANEKARKLLAAQPKTGEDLNLQALELVIGSVP